MNESKITTRYAKAIFQLAQENNLLDRIKQDLDLVTGVLKIDEFQQLIKSPIIPESQKKVAFTQIFKGKVHEYTLDFLLLVIENRREAFLSLMLMDFYELYKKYLGITEVHLTTAVDIDTELKKQFIDILKESLNSKIDLYQKTDPQIIGGFILRVEDKLLDMSISSQLKQIKKELTK